MSGQSRQSEYLEKKWFYPFAAAVLFASALIVYLPSFDVPFHFDDFRSILNNPYIRVTPLSPHSLYSAAFQDFKQNRPLSNLSFALNYYFNQLHPFGYHAVNFIFHLISGFCLWLLLERLLVRRMKDRAAARLAAFLSAWLWMLHPINTQAVTYIVQRHSVMAGAFSLLSLLCYDLGRNQKKNRYYILCGLSCLCALLCKETAYVLPVFIFLYELWFFQELRPGWLKLSWKWAAALLVFYLALSAFAFRGQMSGKLDTDIKKDPFTWQEHSLSQGRVLLQYAGLVIYPSGAWLSLEHEPDVSDSLVNPMTTVPAFLLIFGLIGFALLRAGKYPLLSFGILWYFGQLAIEALPLPIDLMNEHRLYLASVSILAAVPVGFAGRQKNLWPSTIICLLIGILYGTLTYERNQVWQTPSRLWRDSIMKAPHKNRPWNNYCTVLIEHDDIDRAGKACTVAVNMDPSQAESRSNLGICFMSVGNKPEAEKEFLKAIELDPGYGFAYYNLGSLKAGQGDDAAARQFFEKAMQLQTPSARVYLHIGEYYEKKKETENAARAFETAVSMQPENIDARLKAASALVALGDCPKALELAHSSPVKDSRMAGIISPCIRR